MAQPQRHDACTHQFLLLLLLLLLLPSAKAASFSRLCGSTPPSELPLAEHQPSYGARLALSLTITGGHFSGGRDLHFAGDRPYTRDVTFFPRLRSARATSDPAVTHFSATLTLEGTRAGFRWRESGTRPYSVTFDLDGYYNSTPAAPTSAAELCMVGSGSYAREDGSGVVVLSDVVLRLHVPQPANLSRPFVTGAVEGADFRSIALLAYAVDGYVFEDPASCPAPPAAVRGAREVLSGYYSCNQFTGLLRGSYTLEYKPNEHGGASFPLRLRRGVMHVHQIACASGRSDAGVRAYMVLYANESDASPPNSYTAVGRSSVAIGDEALVADGFWDPSRTQLCLRACRVAAAAADENDDLELQVRECGIRVSLWFPAVWSIRDRSIVSGKIWNASGDAAAASGGGVISVSRAASYYRGQLSGVSYSYTRVEEAKKHYHSMPALSKERKGWLPGNESYRDFVFRFFLEKEKQGLPGAGGHAWPVAIASALVEGDQAVAEMAFRGLGEAGANNNRLLNVSYTLEYHRVAGSANSKASSSSPRLQLQLQRVSAEGVYDTKSGSLCMVACQATSNGSSDCDVLVTFQFAPVNSVSGERGVGAIRSLREPGDPLFFEALDIVSYGISLQQREESSSRMDMESVMLVVSMALSCAFTALQLRHVSRHPEALPATSVTMLVVVALGYVIPLVLNLEDDTYHTDARRRYVVQLTTAGSLDLNEFMLRASTMLALVLQLRLLHLALSRRSTTTTEQAGRSNSKHEGSSSLSSADAERSTLWICLPLYALGAVVVWIVHMSDDGHRRLHGPLSASAPAPAPSGPALVDDLAAYAGLILDGFLLPQVVLNALSGSRVRALSPWFYAGGTVIRAAPHAYDVFRKRSYYVPSATVVYASPRDDLFGVAWDVAIPCGATLLAALLFLQQRLGGAFLCCFKSRRSGSSAEYEMVSSTATISSQ